MTETKFNSKVPNLEVMVLVERTISPKTSLEPVALTIVGLFPLNWTLTFPSIAWAKVQLYSGLSLKLIFTPKEQVKALSPIFKLSIEATLDEVIPVISDVSFIITVCPSTDTGVIVIFPNEENTEPGVIVISLKVSPGELKEGVPFKLHSMPPLIRVFILQSKSVPECSKVILLCFEQVMV